MAGDERSKGSSVAADLIDFLNASPTAFHAVEEAKKILKNAGYEQISERKDWSLEAGKKYYFTRNHSTIVAFAIGKKGVNDGFKVNTQTHLVPVLATSIKAELDKVISENGPVESGISTDGKKSSKKSKTDEQKHHSLLLQLLADEVGCEPNDICDFELQACDTQPSIIAGAVKEFVYSGRLDNLCMSFCSLKSLIDATTSESSLEDEAGVRMVALFDHEEVGSNSAQGAGSPVMFDALSRVTYSFSSNSKLLEKAIQKSFLVSADMAHALHPNYMDKHEDNHQPKLHGGLVIKHNANQRYATNAVTSFIFREIAAKHNLPIQDFVVRNDMPCGSTIGPILASGTGIRTVDVGAPQLSMHSIREMCAVDDVQHSYEHFKAFFQEFSDLDAKILVDA
ncbi:probable aspartyl aminopeptidase isoform X2 [Diospyros lotus]|uniref:probable aspartyl aminopeptidase isoform X2 n=1 Tax=Diospyros lotus TaxID=55363 RepID=UPI00225A39D1|nr:probable aspartyl aminopeptidase isoform X2 [Diospyros lotus]